MHAPAHAAPTRAANTTADRSLSWVDRLTLGAIGVIVVVVTLPVLRGFGLRENESDAVRMLRVLAAEPAGASARSATGAAPLETGQSPALGSGSMSSPAQASLAALAGEGRGLHRRLEDLELLPDGRLRRHGYLFDVVTLAAGEPMLRAWPWEHAQTGRGAFVWTPRRGILGFANVDGRFSGPGSPPEATDVLDAGWVAMPRR